MCVYTGTCAVHPNAFATEINCSVHFYCTLKCNVICFSKIQIGVAGTMEREVEQAPNKVPIVYSKNYSVRFAGLEKLHPFDAAKGKHIQQVKTNIQNGYAALNLMTSIF